MSTSVILPADNHYYQNIKMRLADDGCWDLIQIEAANLTIVESVEVQVLESFPVQVNLVISGYLPDGCTTLSDDVVVQRIDNSFHIFLFQDRPADMVCAAVVVPYSKTLSLDVSGLAAGTYGIKVNDKVSSFDLLADNKNIVCCQSYCCTCAPNYWHYSYNLVRRSGCQRPENIDGGNCYEIVDNSYCSEGD